MKMHLTKDNTKDVKKIFVRGLNFCLGDSLMTTPFFEAIKYIFPNASVDLVVPKSLSRIFDGNPNIDNIIHFEPHGEHKSIFAKLKFFKNIRQNKYDVAFLLQRAIEAAVLSTYAKIPNRIGYDSDYRGILLTHGLKETWSLQKADCHQVDYYLNILRKYFNLPNSLDLRTKIYTSKENLTTLNNKNLGIDFQNDSYIIFSIGTSFSTSKMWDSKNWAELAKKITIKYPHLKIIFLGVSSDKIYSDEVVNILKKDNIKNIFDISGKTSISDTIEIVNNSKISISVDNGTSHLAAALNKNLITLFGSSNPTATAPYKRESDIIFKQLECAPCCDKDCALKHNNCMNYISVEEVFEKVKEKLAVN